MTDLTREADEQRAVIQLYEAVGAFVYNLSQYSRSERRSQRTPGIPDLYVMCPGRGLAWWHELNAPDGRQSAAQALFQERCRQAHIDYVLGGRDAASNHLQRVGIMLGRYL